MIYRCMHRTSYEYTDPVSMSHNQVHLRPRDFARQTCRSHSLEIHPTPERIDHGVDYFGNHLTFYSLSGPHPAMEVTARCEVELLAGVLPEPGSTPAWETIRDRLRVERDPESLAAFEFTFDSPFVPLFGELNAYAETVFTPDRPIWEAVVELSRRIHKEFTYDPGTTQVSTPLQEVLAERHGVCQDFAHLMIGCLRSIGLGARYISGYLPTRTSPGQKELTGADASHAWVQVYCGEHGWLDIDPTNNVAPSLTHVLVAWGRDYGDVSPVRGVILGGGEHAIDVAVEVLPVDPRTQSVRR